MEQRHAYGRAGDDTLIGGGGDTFYDEFGNDTLQGGDGADLFYILETQDNDTVEGGLGGGWTDVIELQDDAGGNKIGKYGTAWTLQLDSGSIEGSRTGGQSGRWIDLTDDAAGTITMQDGTEIDFTGIEHIQW